MKWRWKNGVKHSLNISIQISIYFSKRNSVSSNNNNICHENARQPRIKWAVLASNLLSYLIRAFSVQFLIIKVLSHTPKTPLSQSAFFRHFRKEQCGKYMIRWYRQYVTVPMPTLFIFVFRIHPESPRMLDNSQTLKYKNKFSKTFEEWRLRLKPKKTEVCGRRSSDRMRTLHAILVTDPNKNNLIQGGLYGFHTTSRWLWPRMTFSKSIEVKLWWWNEARVIK